VVTPQYAELAAATNFSFLKGASHADEMVLTAAGLGLGALGIADRNTCAGLVRAHAAAREVEGLRLIVGARLVTTCGFEVIAYPETRRSYGVLSQTLTRGNRRAPKGECFLTFEDLAELHAETRLIVLPPDGLIDPGAAFREGLARLREGFGPRVYLGLSRRHGPRDARRLAALHALARSERVKPLAVQDALYHTPERKPLADVLCCIREKTTIQTAGRLLEANAERHLKSPQEIARLFKGYEDAVASSAEIVAACTFSLDELSYQYPDEVLGEEGTPQDHLETLTWQGAGERYPGGIPDKVRAAIAHELALIADLQYAPYFLTVHDLVRFARTRGILCQGRGSAANSVVCYCLGVTAVDPTKIDLLFERFVSAERGEPPDIDVDFEHERREEVIQYIYEKYGRERAGIAATVITYRGRSAVREVGKALGLSEDMTGALAGTLWGWSAKGVEGEHVRELGLDPDDPVLALAMRLTRELIGFPRHLSQHVGGFVVTRDRLDSLVPVCNAAMADRTFIEWDKDDLESLGMLKVDVLALGMLTCIAEAFDLLTEHYDRPLDLASVPPEDPAVYDMICRADTIGVFQIESRAQMSMLPRLKPRCFYDLVIEVAIVRPGPIQGDMVHPYLRRREGNEAVSFPSKELEDVLGKTLGVPLFQEQAMKIAIVAADFTPSEADQLRRAMATFRKVGIIHQFGLRLVEGMVSNGYERDFAERCFKQIEGFGEYGFPESHAASFALLVYVSSWLKCHYPDVFCCAILNAQPMGFYAPAQLVRDAREHGVTVRPPDVNRSDWDAVLEPLGAAAEGPARVTRAGGGARAVRLGLRQIKGLNEADAQRLVAAREGGYDSVRDLWLRARLSRHGLERLAEADAFRSLGLDRRAALWAVSALKESPLPLLAAAEAQVQEAEVALPPMPLGEHVVHDYAKLRLSLKAHPMSFLRARFAARGCVSAADLKRLDTDKRVMLAGLVLVRQRPGSAKGVIFATLEDETGTANVIVWPKTFEAYRKIVLGARLLFVRGRMQREGIVIHVIADHLEDRSGDLTILSEDRGGVDAAMDGSMARADEVKRPSEDPRLTGEDKRAETAERRARAKAAAILPRSRDFH